MDGWMDIYIKKMSQFTVEVIGGRVKSRNEEMKEWRNGESL